MPRFFAPSVLLIATGALTFVWACGSLDEAPKEGFNSLSDKKNPTVTKPVTTQCTIPDAGACDVTYSKDVAPLFEKGACWSGGCHGGSQPPIMKAEDLTLTWCNLKDFNGGAALGSRTYINPSSKDPKDSYIVGNLKYEEGSNMPKGLQLSATDIATVETWVKCGAPFN